jgi:hypothetical protein
MLAESVLILAENAARSVISDEAVGVSEVFLDPKRDANYLLQRLFSVGGRL